MDIKYNDISRLPICEYINYNVCELSIQDRLDILQMIVNSVDNKKIQDKGDGVQIKMVNISTPTLIMIRDFVKKKLLQKDKQDMFLFEEDLE